MSSLLIEKSGTGIGSAHSFIEKDGTGIEKDGTGCSCIDRSGTGLNRIEKSGTGISRVAAFLAMFVISSIFGPALASEVRVNLVKQDEILSVSVISDHGAVSGAATIEAGYALIPLFDVSSHDSGFGIEIGGNGTGSEIQIGGNGTGSEIQIGGNGTGSPVQIGGNGTGSDSKIGGNGTGDKAHSYDSSRRISAPLWGYVEVALNDSTGSVLLYHADDAGKLTELAAAQLPIATN